MSLLDKHYHPTPSSFISRYKFHTRIRQPGESIGVYVAQLKEIGQFCAFGEDLDNSVRDRLVIGVNDTRIQCRLLQETDLTFKKAFEIAQSMELSDQELSLLQKGASSKDPTINRVHKPRFQSPSVTCYRCGDNHHTANTCRFRHSTCRSCGKLGHIAKVCRSKPKAQAQAQPPDHKSKKHAEKTHSVTVENITTTSPPPNSSPSKNISSNSEAYSMFPMSKSGTRPIILSVKILDKILQMELDTGASLSLISEETFNSTFGNSLQLNPSSVVLHTYSGEPISVLGSVDVPVFHNSQSATVPLVVVKGKGQSLFGRNWMEHFRLDWSSINKVQLKMSFTALLLKYSKLFQEQLGTLQGTSAKIVVTDNAQPRFFKARQVPYILKDKVEKELERLQKQNVITPVQFSDWAAPIVPVVKSDGTIHICGDYKLTANQVAKLDTYPLPRIEDLYAVLSGGTIFSKLDLAHAYQQICLDDDSKKYTTINTSRGLFQYERLPFGISSAPSIFQRIMDSLLQGIPFTCAYI